MSSQNKTAKQNVKEAARRRRVKRLKSLIIGVVVILLFLSVILNFILAFKVLRLEQKVEQLYSQEYVPDNMYV